MRKHETIKLSSILDAYLKQNGLEDKYLEREIAKNWEETVGSLFSRYTSQIDFYRGVLKITMTSAAAKSEITMAKSKLITMMNEKLGKKIISDLIVR